MDTEIIDESEILAYLDAIPPTPHRDSSEAVWNPLYDSESPPF